MDSLYEPVVAALKASADRMDRGDPWISIIIAPSDAATALNCLTRLCSTLPTSLSFEILFIVAHMSRDDIDALPNLPLVRVLTDTPAASSMHRNHAAMHAAGRYLCFLDAAAITMPAWLDHLVVALANQPHVVAAGSQLRDASGLISCAGGIVFRDASTCHYGRGERGDDPRFSYGRPVDYCPGDALLVNKAEFIANGGFSETYHSLEYRTIDLCFRLRASGTIYYEPRSVVSLPNRAPGEAGVRAPGQFGFSPSDRQRFLARWDAALQAHVLPAMEYVEVASRSRMPSPVMLVIDANEERAIESARIAKHRGWSTIWLPLEACTPDAKATLHASGVEVLDDLPGGMTQLQYLSVVAPVVDFVYIPDASGTEKFMPSLPKHARIVDRIPD